MRRGKPWPTMAMAAALAQAFQRALWPRRVPGGAAGAAAGVTVARPKPTGRPIFAAAASTGRASLVADAAAAAAAVAAGLGGRRPDLVQCLVAAGGGPGTDRAAVIAAGRAALAGLGGGGGAGAGKSVAFLGGAVSAVYDPASRRPASSGVAVWAAALPEGSVVSTFCVAGSSLPALDDGGRGPTAWPAFLVEARDPPRPGEGEAGRDDPPTSNTMALILADAGFADGAADLAARLAGALPPDAAVAAGVLPRLGGGGDTSSVLLAGADGLPPPGTRAVGVLMRAPGMAAGCVSAFAQAGGGGGGGGGGASPSSSSSSSTSSSSSARVGQELAAQAADAGGHDATALVYSTPGAWAAATAGLADQAAPPPRATLAALVGGACSGEGSGGGGEAGAGGAAGAVLLVRAV